MPNQTLQKLLDGNSRFVAGTPERPRQNLKRRAEIAEHQAPEAIILSCSDSRVAPEILFDQGLGDLFVIRTAGQVVDNVPLASIEYGAEHLKVPLIIVLGHKRCGAVKATVDGGELPGHLHSLTFPIKAAVETVKSHDGDLLDNAIKANVRLIVKQLQNSEPILSHLVKDNKLTVVGAYYDLDTGAVSLVE